jgi:hypothetical protein
MKTVVPQSGTILSSKICWGLPIDFSLQLIYDLSDTHGAPFTSNHLSFSGIPGDHAHDSVGKGWPQR